MDRSGQAIYENNIVGTMNDNFDAIRSSFPKQPPNSAQDTILFWFIRMVFAGDFENCGESVCKGVYLIPYSFRNLAVASKSALAHSHMSDFSSFGLEPLASNGFLLLPD